MWWQHGGQVAARLPLRSWSRKVSPMESKPKVPPPIGDGGARFEQTLGEVLEDPISRRIFDDTIRRVALLDEGRRIRKDHRISQKDVAAAMGTSQSAISDIEKGRVDPQLQTLQRYARALGRRFEFALVDPELPSAPEGSVNSAVARLEDFALGPLLTAMVERSKEERVSTAQDLANDIDLAMPWTEALLARLKADGAVVSVGDGANRAYALDYEAANLVGVSLEREEVHAVLVDRYGNCHAQKTATLSDTLTKTVVGTIVKLVASLEKLSKKPLLSVGVCLPGIITGSGAVDFVAELKTDDDLWSAVPLRELLITELRDELHSPDVAVVVENDANALAMNEYLRKERSGNSVVTLLMTERGTGSGIIMDGNLIRGAHNAAGEGGHTIVDPKGPKCRAGLSHNGCLETVASMRSVLERIGLDVDTPESFAASVGKANKLVEEHDPEALNAFRVAGEIHGRFISTTIVLLDPDRVVIYGEPYLADRSLYACAQPFQSGFNSAYGDALGSRTELVGDTAIEWVSLTGSHDHDVRAMAAGAAAFWHFLQQPTARPSTTVAHGQRSYELADRRVFA